MQSQKLYQLTGHSQFLVLGPLDVAFPSCLQFSGCTATKLDNGRRLNVKNLTPLLKYRAK